MRKSKKFLATVLMMSLCASIIHPTAYATEIGTQENNDQLPDIQVILDEDEAGIETSSKIKEQQEKKEQAMEEDVVWDGKTKESVYEGDNFKVTFLLQESWETGYNAKVVIENTSETTIRNWYLRYNGSYNVDRIWNAEIEKKEDSIITVKNTMQNQDIYAGKTVEYGFSGKGKFPGFPTVYDIVGTNVEANVDDYEVDYNLGMDWGSGFASTIQINNKTEQAFENWALEFDYAREINSIWNASIESHEGNHYVIRNAGYNTKIDAGSSVVFGFQGTDGTSKDEPTNCVLYKHALYKNGTTNFNVSFNLNYEDAVNTPKKQTVKANDTVEVPEDPERDGYVFVGWYSDSELTNVVDLETMPVQKDMTLYARWLDINDNTDTDGDGITDDIEEILGTDKTKVDTDGDTLSDYDELYYLGLDPTLIDTDGNGLNDNVEDDDADGLSNDEELNLGSNPAEADSDYDGLNDFEEVNTYKTNPMKKDTDDDAVSDAKEIELGTDPLVAEKSFDVTANATEGEDVKASVTIDGLKGEQVETLAVTPVENETLFPKEMPGYIGEAYNFSVDGTFEEATINFEFDEELLKDEDFDPVIYYFNEKEQELEELETEIKDNVASTKVKHFSTYVLINRKINQESRTWVDVWDANLEYKGVELVIAIDDSGSMKATDRKNNRLEVVKKLVNDLPDGSKVGIIKYASDCSVLTSELTTDKELANKYLTTDYFTSSGDTAMYTSIEKALSLYQSEEPDILKMMVVLSDGIPTDLEEQENASNLIANANVKIYTVGFGSNSSTFRKYFEPLSVNTGGKLYLAKKATELDDIFTEIYADISKKVDVISDSDNDGVPDFYEDNMLMFNGMKVYMDKNNPDTDGDGLLDGEEIVDIKFTYNEDKSKVIVTGKLKANPALMDSDGDGLLDNSPQVVNGTVAAPIDPEPLVVNGPRNMWKSHIKQIETGKNPTRYSNNVGFNIHVDSVLEKTLVKLALKLRPLILQYENLLHKVIILFRPFASNPISEKLGAYFLNFIYDEYEIAYHSQPDTWQKGFGYNDLYDDAFRIGSNMHTEKFEFTSGDKNYVIWCWKGDYWNLESGAEIGLYQYDNTYFGTPHYDVVDFDSPMTLSLYNYRGANNIQNVLSWRPVVKQWWVTGFNARFKNPNPNIMIAMATIDFAGRTQLYDDLKQEMEKDTQAAKNLRKYLIFDEDGHTVWISWYKGVK